MFVESEVERAFFDGPPASGADEYVGDDATPVDTGENDDDDDDVSGPLDDSRYARLSRKSAVAVLALLVAALGWFYAATGSGVHRVAPKAVQAANDSDYDLYHAIVQRVQDGQNYYDAAGYELRHRGYPTRPVFNWRQPTYAFVLANSPIPAAPLTIVGVLALLFTLRWLRDIWGLVPALAVCALHMGALPHSTESAYFQEVWAGAFLLLSVTLYATGRWRWGMVALLAALAFREFILLPCGVAVLFALYDRRWAEVKLWALALPLYGALFTLHLVSVLHHLGPADHLIPSRSWLAFGGARFLVQATRVDLVWYYLPPFVNALAMPMALFGYGDWRNEGATRMGVILFGFMAAFSLIGLPCNDYWGFLFLPLLSVGLVRFPRALRELVGVIRRPATQPDSATSTNPPATSADAHDHARTTALDADGGSLQLQNAR